VFEELVAERTVELVRRDLLDAGLVATPVTARGLVEVPLFEEPLVWYVTSRRATGSTTGRRSGWRTSAPRTCG
jgi:DNA-binding transcriptional LysR family regulator